MLTVLRNIIQEVSAAQDFPEALDIMVKRVANALATEACTIFLLDRRHGEYVFVATQGLNQEAVGKVRIPTNKGLIGFVGEREEPINIDDATKHPRFLHIPEVKEENFRAFLGTPIVHHRQILGVMIVQQREPRRYDESEEAFLVTLATQLAGIIAYAESTGALNGLFDSSKEKRHEFTYTGVPGAPGIGIGKGVVIYNVTDLDAVPDRKPDDVEDEISLLEHAFSAVREDMRVLGDRLHPVLPAEERALFDVYQKILDSDDLGKEIADAILAGNWAQGALREVIDVHVRRLESLDNEYMRERAADIKDLGRRVLSYLQEDNGAAIPHYSLETILIGEVITPSDLAEVPEGCLRGIVSLKGSTNSHVAILARAMKVPTIMGLGDLPIDEMQAKDIIVDGYYGQVYISPPATLQAEFELLHQEEQKLDATLEEIRDLPAETKDGHRITLFVNTGLGADISISLAAGAEGVGLYRTEIPFLVRDRFPSSEEQRIIYRQLLASFAPRPVILRTLDVGGDKPLPYFPIKEDNPFLGWRGIRITLDHPEIFLSQIRAMLRASVGLDNMRIMLPMITDVSEVDEALRLLHKAYGEIRDEGYDIQMPQTGVMIEVPSAVYQSRAIAKRVDFLSVGSNDLTQYILAVDRNNARVANLYDALHPAVLRALMQTVENGHQEGKHVSICGELAGDPVAVMLLFAMGFDSLSMNATAVCRARWIVRHFTQKKAAKLLHEVLGMESAVMIRCHMELALERAGLGNIIRSGR